MEKTLVPKIRFQGFNESWNLEQLKNMGVWKRGQSMSKEDISDDASNPCIHYGELFSYGEIISDVKSKTNLSPTITSNGNELLFPDSDVTPDGLGRCSAITKRDVILGSGINILCLQDKYYAPFCSLNITKHKKLIIERVKGTTVRHIHTTDLGELFFNISTNYKEQRNISFIFEKLNSLISSCSEELVKLTHFKQSCMLLMFPCNDLSQPKLRFKEFNNDWEIVKIGDIMDVGSVKRVHQSDWTNKGIRFLRARDIVAAINNEPFDDFLYISREMYNLYSSISGKVSINDLLVTGVGTIGVPFLIKDNNPLYFKDGNIIT